MSPHALVFRYAAFAIAAALVNLAAQRMVLSFGTSSLHFAGAVGLGTLAGLVVKYMLDKRWIFYNRAAGVRAYGRQFGLYTVMGGVTTLVFWGVETAFWYAWQTDIMREAGAVLGLAIGYVVKYNLDKQFVFKDSYRGFSA